MSEEPASGERLEQARTAYLREEFGASVGAIVGFVDMLIEDAHHSEANDLVPDLERMRHAGTELAVLLERAAGSSGSGGEAIDPNRLRHDLRTPLNAIKGYGELLLEEAGDGGRALLVADLTRVVALAGRLIGEIDDLVARSATPAEARASPIAAVTSTLLAVKPLAGADAEDAGAPPSLILVVDDNAANRDLLSRRLARQGHRVVAAESGEAALELIDGHAFDLVLLDLMMPGMSGFEVLSRLKAGEASRHIPVIMISALDEIDSTVRCIEAGAEDYLAKPFNPVLLRARIDASLEKKRLRDREQAILDELRTEKERSEALLLNILPRSIVDRMRRGATVIADRFEEATILFSDLVDFTALAARLTPERTVELLDAIFARFDDLAERYGLEKIKTLGDGYMVAGGLPEARPDHVGAVAEMALAMLDIVPEIGRGEGLPLELRVGVHSGALVAGVIGTRKFVYDVWGDTVNTAKRMESYGVAGRVHVSAVTRAALGERFRFEPRGAIEVKGKGLMETFFLDRLG
ncbi:MAG TPA: adenylate/guanylate cyclase domain-containing protein [Stellaceae bacterium]|nr:adenylate/guanylate cyclase domain-containing protein [Stellaceae bacterium]